MRAASSGIWLHRTRNRRMPIGMGVLAGGCRRHWHPLRTAGVVRKASTRSGIDGTASLAAADLAWRARASDKATRRGRLPGLLSVVLRGSGGSGRHRRLRSPFYRGCGPCGTGQGVVLLEAAVFVFAAGTAWAGLVAPRSSNRPSSHGTSVHPPKLVSPDCARLRIPDWRHQCAVVSGPSWPSSGRWAESLSRPLLRVNPRPGNGQSLRTVAAERNSRTVRFRWATNAAAFVEPVARRWRKTGSNAATS